jgi:hypothetical protein
MKKTAVEFLMSKLFDPSTMVQEQIQWFEQAKAMEKEQMRDVWDESRSEYMGDNYIGKEKSFEDYYNETFKANEK